MIGLTGGAGSGKSSAAAFLGQRNDIRVIDADELCRLLLRPKALGWSALHEILGEKYFQADKSINRRVLRAAIFADQNLRLQINELLHPLVRREIKDIIDKSSNHEGKGALVEVPLLYEAGWQEDFDEIIVVYAEPEKCIDRLLARDKITRSEAEAMLQAQWPLDKKVAMADHVIDNSGLWADTCIQMISLEKELWTKSNYSGKVK